MIKFRASGDGREVVGLGLTARNIELLKQGKPILVKLSALGIETNIEITIIYGEDEKSLYRDLRKAGLVSDETQIKVGH